MTGTPTSAGSRFAATRWSIVLSAANWRADPVARRAMSELAQRYWFPLYAWLRRSGKPPAEAEDLVQGFFARMLEKDALASVDREKGKFRSFLLTCLKNYLANERDKARALKRGESAVISLDALEAEKRYAAEPVETNTPQRVFERRWALAVLDRVLARLREEYAAHGRGAVFSSLQHVLVGGEGATYARIGGQLKMSESAVKVAAHRMRRRYRELLREEIAQTVCDPAMIDEEIRELLASV